MSLFSAAKPLQRKDVTIGLLHGSGPQVTIVSKRKQANPTPADLRRQLDEDVAKFLKSGKKIQQIPTGVSTQDYSKGRKHIVLGNSKTRG